MHTTLNVYVLVCFAVKVVIYYLSCTVLRAGNMYHHDQKQDGPQICGAYRLFAYKVTHKTSKLLLEAQFWTVKKQLVC